MRRRLPHSGSEEGLRGWAFAATLGGCATMTLLAAVGLFLLRNQAGFIFWLSLAAHAHIMVGMTAIGALFIRRTIRVDRNGIEITDHEREASDHVEENSVNRHQP